MEAFKKYIASIIELSDDDWTILGPCLELVKCKRNGFLLKEGQVCKAIYFVCSGFCKAFYNLDGREVNTAFYFENEFATNIKSLRSANPSEYSIKACEPMLVVRIDKDKLLHAYSLSHRIEAFGRKVLELIMMQQEDHANSFKILTPRERFDMLVKQRPDFLQRVSLTQTASYLGISRETLTRFRSRK